MPNTKLYTLTFIIGDGQVLLGLKKRGFSEGKWMGYGGKRDGIESLKQCVQRELHEKSNLEVEEDDLVNLGFIQYKLEHEEKIDHRVYIFSCVRTSANGILRETEEFKPEWFDFGNLPYTEMTEDSPFWLPLVFKQVHFEASFTMDDYGKIKKIDIEMKNKES